MATFKVKGSVTLENVDFYVEAEDLNDAQGKVLRGDYQSFDKDNAHVVAAHLAVDSLEQI